VEKNLITGPFQKAKSDAFDLAERLQVFAKKDLIKVWKAGLDTVRKILEILGTDHTNEEVRLTTFISARLCITCTCRRRRKYLTS